jgi:hypothetical protein
MTDSSEILEMMAALQLSGMRACYDEIVTMGVKHQQRVQMPAQGRDRRQASPLETLSPWQRPQARQRMLDAVAHNLPFQIPPTFLKRRQ